MVVNNNAFLVKQIQNKESLIAAYCQFTNMPFVVCDPDTYNDQVWLFDTEADLQEFAKPYTEKKILLRGTKMAKQNYLPFFSMLFSIGVNELVFVSNSSKQTIELDKLVKRPDFSKLPKEQQPVLNPELQLTGLYFMQEASRPVKTEEKENIADLEEELAKNMFTAKYIVPVELLDGPETDMEKLKNKKYRLPILKNKNDQMFQPIYTDPTELAKMNKDKKFRALVMAFSDLSKILVKESAGFILNPAGYHILMPEQLVKSLGDRFEA